MTEIQNMSIGGAEFFVEDEAASLYGSYMADIAARCRENDRDEVLQEVSSRIAEILSQQTDTRYFTVSKGMMENAVTTIGPAESFGFYNEDAAVRQEAKRTRITGKLHLSSREKVLGGVCGGLAEYLDTDPVIVRILMAAMIMFGGAGILIYMLMWIILPRE